jgi:hypothetical protein
MTLQFIRQIRITFGPYGEEGKQTYELRTQFSIQKTKKKEPNTAQIMIFNLSEDSRSLLAGDDVFFQIESKWREEDQWSLLASGDVSDLSTYMRGPDIITEVSITDGFKDIRDTTISKSYPSGTSVKTVIQDLVNQFKRVDAKSIVSNVIDSTKELITGGTLSGNAFDNLEKILNPLGYVPRIQDNDLIIEEKFSTLETEIYSINPNSGLIGSPQKKTFTIDKQEKKGIVIQCLLNPRINVGSRIKVESKFVSGEYLVYNLTHTGDSQNGSQQTMCECLEL